MLVESFFGIFKQILQIKTKFEIVELLDESVRDNFGPDPALSGELRLRKKIILDQFVC